MGNNVGTVVLKLILPFPSLKIPNRNATRMALQVEIDLEGARMSCTNQDPHLYLTYKCSRKLQLAQEHSGHGRNRCENKEVGMGEANPMYYQQTI
jgi:hypothetical protein